MNENLDERFIPRPELEQTLVAFKAEVKTALTRQTILILGSVVFIKSDIQIPDTVTVGAMLVAGAGFAWKATVGILLRG